MEGKAVEVAFHFNTTHFRSFDPVSSLYWNKSNLRKKNISIGNMTKKF